MRVRDCIEAEACIPDFGRFALGLIPLPLASFRFPLSSSISESLLPGPESVSVSEVR